MTQRDRTVVLVLAALALVAGFWFFALKPKREKVSAADSRIVKAQSDLSAADSQLAAARSAKDDYPKNYATVANLGKAVPVDENVDTLTYQLTVIARRNGVAFQGFDLKSAGGAAAPTTSSPASASVVATLPPGAAVGAAGFPTMPFSFTFQGSFFTLQKFMADLNGLTTVRKDGRIRVRGRLLQIDGVGLQPGPKGFPFVEAKFAATAYVIPESQGLTSGGSPSSPSGSTTPAQ